MTERERLIELLYIIIQPGQKTLGDIADHFLANGVIVPPCKVGDTVYTIIRTYSTCHLGGSWDEIRCDGCEAECDSHATLSIGEETVTAFRYDGKWSVFTNKSHMFAKTIGEPRYGVLLTKEEAEKALAERSEGK